MEAQFSPDQRAFIQQAIQSGRIANEQDAMREALQLWEERERKRAEILFALEQAENSIQSGNGRLMTNADDAQRFLADISAKLKITE